MIEVTEFKKGKIKAKVRIYKTVIRSTVKSGSEMWKWNARQRKT